MSFRHLTRSILQERLESEVPVRVRALRDLGFLVSLPPASSVVMQTAVRVGLVSPELNFAAVLSSVAYYEWLEGHDVQGTWSRVAFTPADDPALSRDERDERLATLLRVVGINDPTRSGPDVLDQIAENAALEIELEEDRRALASLEGALSAPLANRTEFTPHGLVARRIDTSLRALRQQGLIRQGTVAAVRPGPNGELAVDVNIDLPARIEQVSIDLGVAGDDQTVVTVREAIEVAEEHREREEAERRFVPGRALDLGSE